MLPHVLLAAPFEESSARDLVEGGAERKVSAFDRRMALARAWDGRVKPAPQVGQVWVVAAHEVVVTEILTHYNTPDRIALPAPNLRWRSRPRGKTGVDTVAIFTQRYSPAWLPGDAPLTEGECAVRATVELLDETVQQVRAHLDGNHQVIDLGTIGLFRVYSVVEYPIGNHNIIPVRNLHRIHGHRWPDFLKKVHTRADYERNRASGTDDVVHVSDPAAENRAVLQNIKAASDAILALGVRRQRDVLILRDLSGHVNRLTGGGVGGYAYRRTHAIEADAKTMATPYGVELLVHEWGHKQFFNLPQHVTRHVREWFDENLIRNPRVKAEVARLMEGTREIAISHAWDAFRAAWAKWDGVFPDHYLRLRKSFKGREDQQSALLDVFMTPGLIGVGTMKKGLRNPEGGEGIRKGESVFFLSARATGPDAFMVVRQGSKGGNVETRSITTTADVVRTHVEVDAAASAKRNNMDSDRLAFMVDRMREAPADAHENFFTRESFLYSTLDDGITGAHEYLGKLDKSVSSATFFPVDNRSDFVADWRERATSEGDRFDPENTFRALFATHAHWDSYSTPTIDAPSGARIREFAKEAGITPSSYGASNVDELWAELIAHSALNPGKVPKPLRQLFRDALQGKTPGPGERMKQDNTPRQFRKVAASEAVVLLDRSPFLDEMNKHGNKRSHASRVRTYKKSGKMVAQTFSTPNALGGSNTADIVVQGDRAARMWISILPKFQTPGSEPKNPYEPGTGDYNAWKLGWDRVMRDVAEAAAAPPAFELEGSLGIPREKMPQIAGDKIAEFLDYLRGGCELSVQKGERSAGNIKPTQDCVDPEKLGKWHGTPIGELTKNPLIVSSDTYLLDGHHRWAVVVQRKPSARWETWEVDCTMKELLKHARAFDGSFTRQYGESLDESEWKRGYEVPPDYVLLRVTSHRQRGKLRDAFGDEGLNVMAMRPGETVFDNVEAFLVPKRLADKMGSDEYPWHRLKAPRMGRAYFFDTWGFGNDLRSDRDWLRKRGFKSRDASESFDYDVVEGVDDPHVLKAVFLAGGGGSGKGFIGTKAFGDTGLRVVNSDIAFEHLMRKAGLDLKRDVGSEKAQRELRPTAKRLTVAKEAGLVDGRVGLIIDSTGDEPHKIIDKDRQLRTLGYDTAMLFVDVPLDVALARNKARSRVVPEAVIRASHAAAQKAREQYASLFGDRFEVVVNDRPLSDEEIRRDLTPKLARIARRLVGGPVRNPIGRAWIERHIAPGEAHPGLKLPRARSRGGTVRPEAASRMESVVLVDRSPFER